VTDEELNDLARLMVWGLEAADEIDGVSVPADYPLDVRQAARFLGLRVKRARVALSDPRFRKLYAEACEALRNGQRARNLHTAIAIRDAEGEDTAADRQVRLKAITVLEGRDGVAGVNVSINTTHNSVSITPGYVIRLPAPGAPALPGQAAEPMLIEGAPLAEENTP
jgi:hypothetical protein